MSQEIVEIVEIGEQGVWVEAMQQSACSSCNARSGCGQHSLSKLGRKMRLWVPTERHFSVGEQATLTLPDGSLALSALVLYGLPLLAMMLLAVVGHGLAGEPGCWGWLWVLLLRGKFQNLKKTNGSLSSKMVVVIFQRLLFPDSRLPF